MRHGPPPPPAVTGVGSMILLLHTLRTKGFGAMIHEQYTKLGSVFTISFFGLKTTFLIGPEVSAHFYQGLESEISHGKCDRPAELKRLIKRNRHPLAH